MNIGTDIIQSHILVSSSRFSLKITEKNTLVKISSSHIVVKYNIKGVHAS